MTKNDLAEALSNSTRLTKSQSIEAIEGLMTATSNALAEGKSIYLRGFGTFRLVRRRQKKAQNITRKTTILVPAHNVVKFVPGKELKKKVK